MSAYAVISDVHGNLEALESVLREIEKERVDSILFLGDAVGYGPDPNECVDLLKEKADVIIAGNHDWAAAENQHCGHFNPYARIAIEWTRKELTAENKKFLQGLPLTVTIKEDSLFLVHGTPIEPEMWHYMLSEYDALVNLEHFREKVCLLAHSHQPFIIERNRAKEANIYYNFTDLAEKSRYIINAGSVGQPRDGNPDASYVILQANHVEIKRVPYDILVTQNKMRKAGLPGFLIERLALGR